MAPAAGKKKVEKMEQFAGSNEALDFIDALRKKGKTGYLNVVWTVRWTEPSPPVKRTKSSG